MIRTLAVCFSVALAGCASARIEGRFAGFEGHWSGTGTFQGMPSTVTASFGPLLGGAAWSLDLEVHATAGNGEPFHFAGRAQYVLRDGAPVAGNWIDSNGAVYAITPRLDNGMLAVDWGDGAAARGHSEYRIQLDGDLQINDFVYADDGQQRRFATAELRRRY